jgi:uncharacterized membrane protein YeaQ/YmgE (transglycosylase-associated protein family)
MALSWLAGLVVGIVIGLIAHFAAGGGSKRWAGGAVAGLVGAVLGRLLLGSKMAWHPHLIGAVIGAVVVSVIWAFIARSNK